MRGINEADCRAVARRVRGNWVDSLNIHIRINYSDYD